MTIYQMAAEPSMLNGYNVTTGYIVDSNSANGRFDPDYVRCAIRSVGSNNGVDSDNSLPPQVSTGNVVDFWVHFNIYTTDTTDGHKISPIFNANSRTRWFWLQYSSSAGGYVACSGDVLASPYSTGPALAITSGQIAAIDLRFWNNSGTYYTQGRQNVDIYVDGTFAYTLQVTYLSETAYTNYSYFKTNIGASDGVSTTSYFSGLYAANFNTVGTDLKVLPLSGDTAQADWTGTYSNINTVEIDANTVSSQTAGDESVFDVENASTIIGARDISGIMVISEASRDDVTLDFPELEVKSGATTDNTAYAVATDSSSRKTVVAQYAVNPDTTAAWTASEIDALQIGVLSIDAPA